jgi:hypothetical protein
VDSNHLLSYTLDRVSPDLIVRVTSRSMDRNKARQIADSPWPLNALWVGTAGPTLHKWLDRDRGQGELFIGAHDILDDEADWHSSIWLLDPAQLVRFDVTLKRLYELVADDFDLLAAWAGEDALREQSLTRSELLRLVANNELGNRVRYHVSAT